MNNTTDLLELRWHKIAELRAAGIEPYPNDFKATHTVADIRAQIDTTPEGFGESGPQFAVAGRIMAINRFGKAAFVRFRDRTGMLQAYIKKDMVGEGAYELFKQMDMGDFVGLSGIVFQTRTGEWTLMAGELRLLSKAVRPLPEKFHGLRDPEKRYRRRYVDLIMNDEVRALFLRRSRIIQAVRGFLLAHDFLEVETPMMQPIAGGAEATPFVTHHNALGMDLYLRIAPELYLKRLVVGGFERVFEINRNFRNEGVSTRHNPEFTMLEFYQAYATYTDLMAFTERMFAAVTTAVCGSETVQYQGHDIHMGGTWQRLDLLDALTKIGKVPREILQDKDQLIRFAHENGVTVTKTARLGKVLTKLFDALVEPHLIQPTFITGYPVEVSPLSRRGSEHPDFTERFELFVAGNEIANGFSELNDPADQLARFEQQVADRAAGDTEAHLMDRDYIEALEYGMPPTAGEGVGIDRLVMLLTDAPSIREVILFPHMKPAGDSR